MKILFLNPHIDAQHQIVALLEGRGVSVLACTGLEEAWQVLQLHGSTVELAIVHRESLGTGEEAGLDFISRAKSDHEQSDLPIILTTDSWSDAECAAHQATAMGVNAYLKWPLSLESSLIETIETVLGVPLADLPTGVEPKTQERREISSIEIPHELSPPVESKVQAPQPEEETGGIEKELPYLFGQAGGRRSTDDPELAFVHPVGDAVVPGGAAQSPDVETLKKYLLLREQDVAALSSQLRAAQERIALLETESREERAKNSELLVTAGEQKRRIEDFEKEKSLAISGAQGEIRELKFALKSRAEKVRAMEAQVRDASQEMERLKERVRTDIRRIRVREKELENRLEIVRKDSEALIAAREGKIIELKRKVDLLEFNMDLLQNQFSRERETSEKLRERLAKTAQVISVASGLLGPGVLRAAGADLAEVPADDIPDGLEENGTEDEHVPTADKDDFRTKAG